MAGEQGDEVRDVFPRGPCLFGPVGGCGTRNDLRVTAPAKLPSVRR